MLLTIELPDDVEEVLRSDHADLESSLKEAALVELYRQGELTRPMLARSLGVSRLELDGILGRHHVSEEWVTIQEFEEDYRSVRAAMDLKQS